jgi:hypothetical protein
MRKRFWILAPLLLILAAGAAFQLRPVRRAYYEYRIRGVTSSLPAIDRVEVFHLRGTGLRESDPANATDGFPIRPYRSYSHILGQTTLFGADAQALASLWRSQRFDWGVQALCHYPAYGFRYYSGSKLIFETSVCYRCNNFYTPTGWWGFYTDTPQAADLLRRLRQIFPASIATPEDEDA